MTVTCSHAAQQMYKEVRLLSPENAPLYIEVMAFFKVGYMSMHMEGTRTCQQSIYREGSLPSPANVPFDIDVMALLKRGLAVQQTQRSYTELAKTRTVASGFRVQQKPHWTLK